MPLLFGVPFRAASRLYLVRSVMRACVSREFATWRTGRTSPIVEWLRALARLAHDECGGRGVGALGMCLTGGFALAMVVEDCVVAPVLSQPSLPFPVTAAHRSDLGLDAATLARVRDRSEVCVMGLRFTADRLVPDARFARLREELGPRFLAVEIDSRRGNPDGVPRSAHAVLTFDRDERAVAQVIDFLRRELRG
jgi:dienelactone hydrolase